MSEKEEYIKRGTLLNAIKQKSYTLESKNGDGRFIVIDDGIFIDDVSDIINDIPAEDVEPVVRCKDCVAYAGKERKGGGIMMICRINKHEASPEHFCSQGRNRAHTERSGSGE